MWYPQPCHCVESGPKADITSMIMCKKVDLKPIWHPQPYISTTIQCYYGYSNYTFFSVFTFRRQVVQQVFPTWAHNSCRLHINKVLEGILVSAAAGCLSYKVSVSDGHKLFAHNDQANDSPFEHNVVSKGSNKCKTGQVSTNGSIWSFT